VDATATFNANNSFVVEYPVRTSDTETGMFNMQLQEATFIGSSGTVQLVGPTPTATASISAISGGLYDIAYLSNFTII